MQKHAVLITVLFALVVTLFSVSAVFWEFYKLNKQQYINHIFTKYSIITQIYCAHQQKQSSKIMLEANLAVYKLQIQKNKRESKNIV
jgi:two-component system OmpR family sensor kinase